MVQKLILAKRRIMYEVQDKIDKKVGWCGFHGKITMSDSRRTTRKSWLRKRKGCGSKWKGTKRPRRNWRKSPWFSIDSVHSAKFIFFKKLWTFSRLKWVQIFLNAFEVCILDWRWPSGNATESGKERLQMRACRHDPRSASPPCGFYSV